MTNVGTPRVFAPEIYTSNPQQRSQFSFWQKADIWALGVLGYEFITHQLYPPMVRLFKARKDGFNMAASVADENGKVHIPFANNYPRTSAFILRCLEFEPSKRFLDWDLK